jgi:biopolymer transport protein ExbB
MLALLGCGGCFDSDRGFVEIFIWPGGGPIGIILWGLSIVMVALVIQAFLLVRRINIIPDLIRDEIRVMFDNKQYREVIEMTALQPDTLSHIVHAALSEAPRGYSAMEKALQDATEERKVRMVRAVEYLNLLGNVGPMMGLLGTVLGLIMAFFAIVSKDNVSAKDLAVPLGVKLVCTFMGLVIAIPSLVVYGLMKNRIDILTTEASTTAADLIANFKPGGKAA